jgi:hypothetical protein
MIDEAANGEVGSIGQEIGVRARQSLFHHDYDIVCVVPIQADQGGQHLVLIGAVSMIQARSPRLMISPRRNHYRSAARTHVLLGRSNMANSHVS